MQTEDAAASSSGDWRWTLAIAMVSAAAYLALLSRQYIGDGVRYLPMVQPGAPPTLSGSSHFLFPALLWGAIRLGNIGEIFRWIGSAERPAAIVVGQSMNAIFGGVALAALYRYLRHAGIGRSRATWAAAVTGLAHAFALHATDMTEPMPSVAVSLIGAVMVRSAPALRSRRILGGAIIGLASSIYLSAAGIAALLAPAVMVSEIRGRRWRTAFFRCAEFGGAIALTSVAVHVVGLLALTGPGVPKGSMGIDRAAGLFGVVSVRHLLGALLGFANAFAPLRDWQGGSQLFRASPWIVMYNAMLVLLSSALLVGIAEALMRSWRMTSDQRQADLAGAVLWWAGVFLLASFWSPTYEKLWIGGTVATVILVSLLFDADSEPWKRFVLVAPLCFLAALSIVFGILPRRWKANTGLELAVRLRSTLRADDLVICPGWDAPSVYLAVVVSPHLRCLSLTDAAVSQQLEPASVERLLHDRVLAACSQHRRVIFLGLLDLTLDDWRPFYGDQLRLPYTLLAPYRADAIPLEHLAARDTAVTLFESRSGCLPGPRGR